MLIKPKVFETNREFLWTMLFLLSLLLIRLFFSYQDYREFISKPFYYTYVDVCQAYEKTKKGKRYQVLKVTNNEGLTFYTTTHRKKSLSHTQLRLQIFPDAKISFWGYLGTFYVKSRIKEVSEGSLGVMDSLLQKVSSQHEHRVLQSFYKAIFFATPLDQDLREKISMLGVSHLVALSGFHLGILWALLYGVLHLLYKPFQQKYFPYRHALFDVGLLTLVLLGGYVWFVGAPPSLLRSYAMLLVGWSMLLLGIELLSFAFLATIFMVLLVLLPSLLVSLGFWLSVAGVFYIFLLLHHTKGLDNRLITLLVIPIGIFLFMLPVVHMIFDVTTGYQLLSPLLSLLFIPFYPLVMLLHLSGFGDLLDTVLLWLFMLPEDSISHLLPPGIGAVYILLSLTAVVCRKCFYLLSGSSLAYAGYLFF